MTTVESAAIDVERLGAGAPEPSKSNKYKTSGGCGSGLVCAGCGGVIPMNRMEIAVDYGLESGMDSLVLHVKCFAEWLETARGEL